MECEEKRCKGWRPEAGQKQYRQMTEKEIKELREGNKKRKVKWRCRKVVLFCYCVLSDPYIMEPV